MRVLITGAAGFAGRWLVQACRQAGDQVVAVARPPSNDAVLGASVVQQVGTGLREVALDLRDAEQLGRLVAATGPDVIYHLAALSHVGRSWEDPAETLQQNVVAAVNLLEAARTGSPGSRIVWASSCEVYGTGGATLVSETARVAPASPYAVSKAAGEMLAEVYARSHGLAIVRARPFNHAGPGQRPIFIVSSLARQAARARLAGAASAQIVTGNPATRRDFTDVRDVVAAYRLLADDRVPSDAYNVSSGRSVSGAELVAIVAKLLAPIPVEHVVDPKLVRPHEVMDFRGAHERLTAATGWRPTISLRQMMADTIDWWERQLADGPPADPR